jgi:hypothetical protein
MSKEYIGSQEHFEDSVNEYYDRLDGINRQMEKDINLQIDQQIEQEYEQYIDEYIKLKKMKGANMILKEKINKAAEKYSKETWPNSMYLPDYCIKAFTAGVSFAETELQTIAIELLHYYRHAAFEKTCAKSDQEVFYMFMAERSEQ